MDFFVAMAKSSAIMREGLRVSEYFSLGGVIEGLSDIFSHLYGVKLLPVPTRPGELWADDVHKLAVTHETEVRQYIYKHVYASISSVFASI